MATIYKRNKKWHALIRRKGFKTTDKSFDTRKHATIWARDIEGKFDRGLLDDITRASRITMCELFNRYRSETENTKRNSRCEAYMLKMLNDRLGHLTLNRLTREVVAQFRDQRLCEGKSASTVRNNIHLLSAVVNMAITDWGYELPYNPVRRIKKPQVCNARDRRLEPGEEQRLLEVAARAKNPMVKPLIIMALETAMRIGELLSLKWGNVDLNHRQAFLPNTKNGKARNVPLSSVAIAALQTVERNEGEKRVFHWWVGPESIHNMWARLIKKAGITDLRFHDLRHEAASRLSERGMDILRISAITGHSSLQMLKRYTHFRASELAEELDMIRMN